MNEFLKNNYPSELDNKKLNNFNVSEKISEIKLFNRDNGNLKLISEDGKTWKFNVDEKHKYILEFMRYGLDDDNETINMVDPSGGPYLTIGSKIGNDLIINSFTEVDGELLIHTNKI